MIRFIKEFLALRSGVKQAIRSGQEHVIRNATPIIHGVSKRAKMDGRLSDQEYSLINVNLKKIESSISYVHKMNTGKSWLQKKFM